MAASRDEIQQDFEDLANQPDGGWLKPRAGMELGVELGCGGGDTVELTWLGGDRFEVTFIECGARGEAEPERISDLREAIFAAEELAWGASR